MPNMKKGDDVLNVQPVLVDAMKLKGWKIVDDNDKPAESQPSKGDKPKGNKSNG